MPKKLPGLIQQIPERPREEATIFCFLPAERQNPWPTVLFCYISWGRLTVVSDELQNFWDLMQYTFVYSSYKIPLLQMVIWELRIPPSCGSTTFNVRLPYAAGETAERILLGKYERARPGNAKPFCSNSIGQNSIIWPHPNCKEGWGLEPRCAPRRKKKLT